MGAINSDLVKYAISEYEEADNIMPKVLVPIYGYGNGDYLCLNRENLEYTDWLYESGKSESLYTKKTAFKTLLKDITL